MEEAEGQDKKRKSQMVGIIIAIVVAAVVIFGGGAFLFTQLFSGHVKTPEEYERVELTSSAYATTAKVAGVVASSKTSSVSPSIDGTISKVKVKNGDKVKKGTLLMTIENGSVTNALSSAKADYEKKQRAAASAKAKYDSCVKELRAAKKRKSTAKAAYEKSLKAAEKEGVAIADFDEEAYDDAISDAQSAADVAKSPYELAQQAETSALQVYKQAQDQAKLLDVKASDAGTIVDLKVEKGMTTAAVNAAGPAMRIADLDSLVVTANVPEQEIASVARGQEAYVTSGSLPGQRFSATVTSVSETPNDSKAADGSSFYNATLSLASGTDAKVGMWVDCVIQLQDYGTVYYVPASSVATRGSTSYVEVIYDDNTTAQHQVQVVDTAPDGRKIIKGNALGDGVKIRADLTS